MDCTIDRVEVADTMKSYQQLENAGLKATLRH